ncbi:uncharacterized protein RSE6_07652 [Rhynchosporium secalis]|uniref:DUF7918 domain-containing protein n=1 Tax=Rhynchosporium secalis TaxID=38038 RepID=A0A1E1MDD6_RHYSE|nr:uncharacterized protein RSE6_07652 [Rhynchosporium secalis]
MAYDAPAESVLEDNSSKDEHIAKYQRSVTSIKYVEAISGKKFAISLQVEDPFDVTSDYLAFEILVDGKTVSSPLLAKSGYIHHGLSWSKVIEGPYKRVDGTVVLKHMVFAELLTTSESEHVLKVILNEQKKSLVDSGEIVVIVTRRDRVVVPAPAVLPGSVAGDKTASGQDTTGTTKYHTKLLAKEAQSHSTVLGNNVAVDSIKLKQIQTKLVDRPERFLAKFCFRYRSREKLQSLLVIDRNPSPEPEPVQVEAEETPLLARQTPSPPFTPNDAEKRLAKMKEDLQKKQEEIDRHMREFSIKADDNAESVATIIDDPDAASMRPAVQLQNLPTTPRIKRKRGVDDGESAAASARATKKAKSKGKQNRDRQYIEISSDSEDAIQVE